MEQKPETHKKDKTNLSKEETLEFMLKEGSDSVKLNFLMSRDDLEPKHLIPLIDSIRDDLYRMDAIVHAPKLTREEKVKLTENFKNVEYIGKTLSRI